MSTGKFSLDKNGAKILNKTRRTIERYLKSYREEGILFAIHKNKNRSPVNKVPDDLKIEVQKLIKDTDHSSVFKYQQRWSYQLIRILIQLYIS